MESSAARRTVRVSGTVEQANRTFAVDLGRYESPEETYRGREGAVYLPTEVADLIEGVFGLDNRRIAHRAGGGAPPGAVETTPPQVAKLYNFPSCKATGQTIGILRVRRRMAKNRTPSQSAERPGAVLQRAWPCCPQPENRERRRRHCKQL